MFTLKRFTSYSFDVDCDGTSESFTLFFAPSFIEGMSKRDAIHLLNLLGWEFPFPSYSEDFFPEGEFLKRDDFSPEEKADYLEYGHISFTSWAAHIRQEESDYQRGLADGQAYSDAMRTFGPVIGESIAIQIERNANL
jgi:hypothetical protein